MATQSVALVLTKFNHETVSYTYTVVSDDIKMVLTNADGTAQVQYWDAQKAKLDVLETSTNVNTIYAAMTNPQLLGWTKADSATLFRPVIINKNFKLGSTGTMAGYAITAVSTGSKRFTIAGAHASEFTVGLKIRVAGSTGNDREYTVVSSADVAGPNTQIVVAETVASSTADGNLDYTTYDVRYNLGRHNTARPKEIKGYFNGITINSGSGRAIVALSQTNKTFSVAGNRVADFASGIYGQPIRVSGSTGNDKLYIVVNAVYDGSTNTVITVNESIPSSTADGTIFA